MSNGTIAYPPIMAGATQWVWSKDHAWPSGVVPVAEDGLKALLQFVRDTQSVLLADMRGETNRRQLTDLLNRSSTVFVEGDLCMSGLFIAPPDGEPTILPMRNEHIEANEGDGAFAKGPGRGEVEY